MSWFTAPDREDVSKGVRFVLVRAKTPRRAPKEYADVIKTIRSVAKNFDDTERICWENHNKPGKTYSILVPNMDEDTFRIYQDLGMDVQRVYQCLSKKDKKRKRWTRIKL